MATRPFILDVEDRFIVNEARITVNETDIAGKLSSTLTDSNIHVGNTSNVATGVAMSGASVIDDTGKTTLAARVYSSEPLDNPAVHYRHKVITLAQINAGIEVLAAPATGRSIHLQYVEVFPNGTFTGGTTMELENDLGTVALQYAQAQMTDGAYLNPDSAGVTRDTQYIAGVGVGRSLRIEATGTFAGGTDITLKIAYSVHVAVV